MIMVYIQTRDADNMFEEEFEELKFDVNRGRDAFIEQVLNIVDFVSLEELNYISELLEDI